MRTGNKLRNLLIAGLAVGTMMSAFSAIADDSAAQHTYIAVPMHMFKMLTSDQDASHGPEYYTYADGKLVKCTTDIDAKIKKDKCDSHKQHRDFIPPRPNHNHCKMDKFKGGPKEVVLLTEDQLVQLKKQKLEKEIQKVENKTDRMFKDIQNAQKDAMTGKVNGSDVKIIPMPMSPKPMRNDFGKYGMDNMGPNCMQQFRPRPMPMGVMPQFGLRPMQPMYGMQQPGQMPMLPMQTMFGMPQPYQMPMPQAMQSMSGMPPMGYGFNR